MHWNLARTFTLPFPCPSYLDAPLRLLLFSSFLKVPVITPNFINKIYNGGFPPDISAAMFKETMPLVRDYISETRKQTAKQADKQM